jgi:tRNA(Ile)-lysidine synthase
VTADRTGLAAVMAELFGSAPPARIGVALSGGGDSVALLALAAGWARDSGTKLAAVTVDHGLRDGSRAEAVEAGATAARLGVAHDMLTWGGWDGQGNLQDAARRARLRLIGDWAAARDIGAVLLGHTADDQAETVLLRLGRGSGVDGLSGMAALRRAGGRVWARPLLGTRRAALRRWLRGQGIGWAEDPSNADPRFARVRARAALVALDGSGIDVAGLCATADRMRVARAALDDATATGLRDLARVEAAGDVTLCAAGFDALPEELRLRVAARALIWVSGGDYRPRRAALVAVLARGGTLSGCVWTRAGGTIRISREAAAVAGLAVAPGARWDNRWRIDGPPPPRGALVAALGAAGLAACPGWRGTGLARTSLLASPALWAGDRLVAAPLAAPGGPWRARLDPAAGPLPPVRDYRVEPVARIAI